MTPHLKIAGEIAHEIFNTFHGQCLKTKELLQNKLPPSGISLTTAASAAGALPPLINGWKHHGAASLSSARTSEAVPSEASVSTLSEAPSSIARDTASGQLPDRQPPRNPTDERRQDARHMLREIAGLQPVQEDQHASRDGSQRIVSTPQARVLPSNAGEPNRAELLREASQSESGGAKQRTEAHASRPVATERRAPEKRGKQVPAIGTQKDKPCSRWRNGGNASKRQYINPVIVMYGFVQYTLCLSMQPKPASLLSAVHIWICCTQNFAAPKGMMPSLCKH